MNENVIRCNILIEVCSFLKRIGLFKDCQEQNMYNLSEGKYSKDFQNAILNDNYLELFKVIITKNDYDIKLVDDSLFQFTYSEALVNRRRIFEVKYIYYPNPREYEYKTYELYLKDYLNLSIDDAGYDFYDDYEQIIMESPAKPYYTPLRYEYNTRLYTKYIHAKSHLHVGLDEDIRLPIDTILLPEAFCGIVTMFLYYSIWKEKMNNDPFILDYFLDLKEKCTNITPSLLDRDEKRIFYYV